jgi:uncharacterized protein YcbX
VTLSPQTGVCLRDIRLYPIKSLDPVSVKEASIGPAGGLALDRAWALYAVDGSWVNGKRNSAIHSVRAAYAEDVSTVALSVPGDTRNIPVCMFQFPADFEKAAEWFSVYFEGPIIVRYDPCGFPDDPIAHGPTIVSTASLREICDWFPGMSLEQVRLRFRTSLEVDGVSAFWEDRLFGESERTMVRFRVGDVNFEGSNPCARCPVPARDPFTGENWNGFQKRFVEMRGAALPEWAPRDPFDHFYRLATNTRVASTECRKVLHVGDIISV